MNDRFNETACACTLRPCMHEVARRRQAFLAAAAASYTGAGGHANPVGKLAAQGSRKRPLAIAARCWQCEAGGDAPNAENRIAACKVASCGLHPHRPWQDGGYKENLARLKAQAPAVDLPGCRATPIEMAIRDPARRDVAVKAYCYTCMGGRPAGQRNPNGNIRALVAECPVADCALWDVRPWQNRGEAAEDATESEVATNLES